MSIVELFAWIFCGLFGFCGSEQGCRVVEHMNADHTVCSYSVADIDIRFFLDDAEGRKFGSLRAVKRELSDQPLMLMNGGMYHEDLGPVGLYVENGKERQVLSTKGGWGNFHLLPNGVFWIKNGKAGVTQTKAFAARRQGGDVDYATQSGPMLVINGKLHPRFLKDSDSLKIRNGVGVSADGKMIHFAISHSAVRFWDFGELFRAKLKTPNALFLDGTVSAIRAGRFTQGGWKPLGPIIGVFKREDGATGGE